LLASLALLLVCGAAHAHLLNMTKVVASVRPGGELMVDVQVDLSRASGGPMEYYRLSRIERPTENAEVVQLMDRLVRAVEVRADGVAIPLRLGKVEFPKLPREMFVDPLSWPMTHVVLVAASGASLDGSRTLQGAMKPTFPFEEPISLTFSLDAEERTMTRWLVAGQASPSFALREGDGGLASAQSGDGMLAQYAVFGFTHILPKGLDHVLFVLGLYLAARSFRSLLIGVTSFTLAHSITLALASVGAVRLPSSIVEPLIAASIAWVAIESFFVNRSASAAGTEWWRPVVVFGFGLLHGLGFASVLSELRLPPENYLLALLSFNVGIELGQLAVIALAFVVTVWFRQKAWYRARVALPASVAIAALATVWTIERISA
jgi:hypothetical protein